METGSYLPIITLNVNGFKAPTKRQLNEYKNKQTNKQILYLLSTKDPPQMKGHIQTEGEGLEKDILCKEKPKESRESNIHIRSNKL